MSAERRPTRQEQEEQARAELAVAVEKMLAMERATPADERQATPNPKFADPIGLHGDGRPLPGYRPPPA